MNLNPFKAVAGWINGFFDNRLWHTVGGRKTTSKESVSEETALNYSAVWCATRLMCGTGASLPLPIYRGMKSGEVREKARKHPLFRLLNAAPNYELTAYNFRSIMWQWQVNWGNAYAEIRREGDDPQGELVDLWPIHPSRVTPCRDEDEFLYYKVKNETDGGWDELDPWQMLHIPSIITYDGIFGHGVITHARESIGAGIAAEKFGAHTFVSGVPRAVVKTKGTWEPKARNAFREEWDEIYGGADKSRVALLQGDADLVPLNFSAEDSQFLETRQFGVEEIARWYGVPPHMLQHLLRSTFNNIEHQGIEFVQYSLIPWLRIWEQCIWQKLLTEDEQDEYYAEHNVDALMRGDAATRAAFYQSMTSSALMTRNEARKLENLPPVEGGDTFLVQGAMVPLDDDGNPVSKFTEGGTPPAIEPPDEPEDEDETEENTEDVLSVVSGSLRRVLSRDLSRLLTKETKAIANQAKHPKDFVSRVDTFYSEHYAFVLDAVSESLVALSSCGAGVDAESFVATWINEGKATVMEAAGTAIASSLESAIENVTKSKTWTDRPARAVERV